MKVEETVTSTGAETKLPCTVNTFGYGSDHDPTLLKGIADEGSGVYYFIKTNKDVPEAFADCLGGLLSVTAQNITLKIEVQAPVKIKKIFTKFKSNEITPGQVFELSIGDIQSEEQRDIIIMSEIPPVEQSDSYAFADVTLTYFNVLNSSMETKTTKAVIARPSNEPSGQRRHFELDKQYNRLTCADAMKQATDLGNSGKLEDARKAISTAISRIQESISSSDEFCQGLIKDLQTCANGLRDQRAYANEGNQMLQNNFNAHYMQRSTNVQMASQQAYQTSARNMMQQKQQQQFQQ